MISILSLTILGVALAAENKGSLNWSVSIDKDAPACPFTIEVPEEAAGADCKIEFSSFKDELHAATTLEYDFYWKKDSAKFAAADKLTHTSGSDNHKAEAACATAGTYYLGVKVLDCDVCLLGQNSGADVTSAFKKDGVYNTWLDISKQHLSTWFAVAEESYVLFHFTTTAAKSTAHFNVDKCATCGTDDLDYFYVKKGEDYKDETKRTELPPSTTNKLAIEDLPAGSYTMAVYVANGVTSGRSEFRVAFAMNKEPSVSYPDAKCFEEDCSADDLQVCGDCTKANCNWCEKDRKCSVDTACSEATETSVTDPTKCVDIDAKCKEDQYDTCEKCAVIPGCVWCDSSEGVGSFAGTCSAGKGDLGRECVSALATARFGSADKCSAATYAVNALLAVVLALALAI